VDGRTIRRFAYTSSLVALAAISPVVVPRLLSKKGSNHSVAKSPRPLTSGLLEGSNLKAHAWRMLSPSPLEARVGHAGVWTGNEFVIWGGNDSGEHEVSGFRNGAAYDPASDTWRVVPDSPLLGRWPGVMVWTGSEVIVWGGGFYETWAYDGAAFNPSRNIWRNIAASPKDVGDDGAFAWTGTELLLWGGIRDSDITAGTTEILASGAAYGPNADAWRVLPDAPIAARARPAFAWTGKELMIWGGLGRNRTVLSDGAAYNPHTRSWRKLPLSPLAGRSEPLATWTGKELLVIGGHRRFGPSAAEDDIDADAAAYDPEGNSWRNIAPLPSSKAVRHPAAIWTGTRLIVWGGATSSDGRALGSGAAYDPLENQWTELPPSPLPPRVDAAVAWTGTQVLIWGGVSSWAGGPNQRELADGAAYRPDEQT
jgi:N-acetylneuraminic acid mutarotase